MMIRKNTSSKGYLTIMCPPEFVLEQLCKIVEFDSEDIMLEVLHISLDQFYAYVDIDNNQLCLRKVDNMEEFKINLKELV